MKINLLCIVILFLLISCFEEREINTPRDIEQYADEEVKDTDIINNEVRVEDGDDIVIYSKFYQVIFNKKRGYFSINTDKSSIQNAVSEVIDENGNIFATNDPDYTRSLEGIKINNDEYIISILNSSDNTECDIRLIFIITYEGESIKIYEEVINKKEELLKVKKLRPLVLRSKKGGALFIGQNPSEHRILENGSHGFLDFYVRLLPGDVKNDGLGDIFPFEMEGNSVSNWNHCVMDLKSKRIEMSGFLTFERSIPMVNISFDPDYAKTDSEKRKGFSYFSLDCPYIPVSLKINGGGKVASEEVYIDLISNTCQDALEKYARELKRYHKITLWNEKNEPETKRFYRVPNGWNSWSGGSGSGGYGTDINESLILENFEVMKNEFREFGMEWFQIDDGWMLDNGDWYLNKERFPEHIQGENIIDSFQYINNKIYEEGMKSGLWIAGLTAFKSSSLYKDHTEWFAPKLPYASNEYQILDFSQEDAVAFVYNTFRRIKEWGFRWTKLDFSYWVMAAASLKNPNITPVEAYRIGLKTVRDALGENIHLLNVSATGPSIGIADSVRITLDNMPIWDGKSQNLYDMANQGIKPTYVTATRRYYYNQNVWINHPDLIFFRKIPDDRYSALTLDESRAFISFVGITGGIVKIGEKLVEMKPEWIDSVRRVLPVHPIRIRPFDLFLREFPEIWYGKVTDAAIPDYFILGVFNWGKNRDLTTNPYIEIEDRSRDYFINFSDFGIEKKEEYLVYEFWDEKFYGVYQDSFNVNIPPHRAMVFSLRKKSDVPQLIGTNRHILMGAEEVSEYHFDNEKNILTLRMNLAQSLNPQTKFEHRFYFYIPDDYDFLRMENTNDKILPNSNLNKNILLIKMIPEKTSENILKLYFLKK